MLAEEEKAVADESINQADRNKEKSQKKPFYSSAAWVLIWSLLAWPIGFVILWKYADDIQNSKMSRTKLIDKKPEDL
ncbi:hypothetical protein GH808_14555 [Acetobacterium fimetarium]|uniref:Uncharacterized protein n=1 Tax=Acetobacterium fimetarium TaxID=52691 RepID=A0ABR6WYW2_9FIRM|nr:hypothetical protein [Acetobacterium fimetarium]MBC3805628.1 hypothetical protein [Acetobacterium fimetarium]